MKNKTKGKSPAFQFYASDFYMDTISWSDEMVGLHIRLLCQQWINDFIECDETGIPLNLSEKQKVVFGKIKHKYFVEKDTVLKNKKLDNIKKEKKEFIKKASKSGLEGASKRWGTPSKPHTKSDSESMALHSSSSTSSETINNNMWTTIKRNFLQDGPWQMKFLEGKGIKLEVLDEKMNEFLTELELREDYKDLKELKNHFTNWYNKKMNLRVEFKQDQPTAPRLRYANDL